MHDLFFSYRRHDLPRARALLEAIEAEGVRVWRDETDIPAGRSITAHVLDGIASSKALLAVYSLTFGDSRACQQELTTAYLAAQQNTALHESRLFIVCPEPTLAHIPAALRDLAILTVPTDSEQIASSARQIRRQLENVHTPLNKSVPSRPQTHGFSPVPFSRFTGRDHHLWELHSTLTADRTKIISGLDAQCGGNCILGLTAASMLQMFRLVEQS